MKWVPIVLLLYALPVGATGAQTSADTAAIDSLLFDFVVRDLRRGGDLLPPVRVPLRSDVSSWSGRVYARLRAQYPDFVTIEAADSIYRDRPGLTLKVTVRGFRADSGEAIIIWSRCTTRSALLNAWTHDSYFTLKKGLASWVFLRHAIGVSDGHC